MACCCGGTACCYPEKLPETLHVTVVGTGAAAACSAAFDVIFDHNEDVNGFYSWKGLWLNGGSGGVGFRTCFWLHAGTRPGNGLHGQPIAGCFAKIVQGPDCDTTTNPNGACDPSHLPTLQFDDVISCNPFHVRTVLLIPTLPTGAGICPCGTFPYWGQTLTFEAFE